MPPKPGPEPRQFVLDAGALIALERGNDRARAALSDALEREIAIVVPAGVLAQVWRGRRQARIARFLSDPGVDVMAFDQAQAKIAGVLCGITKTTDVVDASIIVCARARPSTIITSDPKDLKKLDPNARLFEV